MCALQQHQSIDEQGKVRVKEHVEGNWAAYVFVSGMNVCVE